MEGQDKAPIIYGMEYQGRALASRGSLNNDFEKIHFICGSQTLQHENKLHMVEYDEDSDTIDKAVYPHPEGEIWQIRCSIMSATVFTTSHAKVHNSAMEYGVTLWKFIDDTDPESITDSLSFMPKVERVAKIPHESNTTVVKSLWNPTSDQLLTYDDLKICLWDISEGMPKSLSEIRTSHKGLTSYICASWNPHHNATQIVTGCGESVKAIDLRSKDTCFTIDRVHEQQVRDIDFNPNKMYHFATCGDDCQVNFWDSRKTSDPLLTREDHTHWVWSVRFNPTHDQLVLSSSSDSQVFMCHVASVASEPLRALEEEEPNCSKEVVDSVVKEYEEHEDSVYSAEWSGVDPWVFASLSYDGRLVINHVPNKEKFHILTI